MIGYILGNYLVRTGKMTKEQLEESLRKMEDSRAQLGALAVSEGLMTPAQAEDINLLQAARDSYFGDLAVEEGYLTPEQLEYLMKKQGDPYLCCSKVLTQEGILTEKELETALEEMRKAEGLTPEQLEDIKCGAVEKLLPDFLPEEAKEYERLAGTVLRTVIRLADRNAYPGRGEMCDTFPQRRQVHQALVFDGGLVDCFAEEDGGLMELAGIFAQEEFTDLNEDVMDAAGEFLNCANGLYISGMSRKGVFLELEMPSAEKTRQPLIPGSMCSIPVYVRGKSLRLVLAKIAEDT
ncbi:MAG: hypothetical protein K6E92_01600 [Lachnospiraceae bacterium]|nr:hypothetical protein [Lachnospiraceae bacterium]